MKLATAEEMRRLDGLAMQQYHLPGLVLMENAGRQVAEAVSDLPGPPQRVVVLAGKGNNGGDGLVAARHLGNAGREVKVFLLARREDVSGDAAQNLQAWEAGGGKVYPLLEERDLQRLNIALLCADAVVDAIYGTGFRGAAQGMAAEAINLANASERPVVAVDLPSGLEADSGRAAGACIRAACTVALGLPKPGLYLHPGAGYAGRVRVADISLPKALLEGAGLQRELLEEDFAAAQLPRRKVDGHKGDYGHLLVVGGSLGMSGAVLLAVRGGLRAGAGLVSAAVPRSVQAMVAAGAAEAMVHPLRETPAGALAVDALPELQRLAEGKQALVLGPGLSRAGDAAQVVRKFLSAAGMPVVLDADGLNALAGQAGALAARSCPLVVTPHPGEMARLLGCPVEAVQSDRLGVAARQAQEWNCVVVLKGAGTVVAAPDGRIFLNTTGNPGLATGGTGDVLAGVIGALLAQGLPPAEAAATGAWLHGTAGDRAAAARGERGLLAGDVAEALPQVLAELEGKAAMGRGEAMG